MHGDHVSSGYAQADRGTQFDSAQDYSSGHQNFNEGQHHVEGTQFAAGQSFTGGTQNFGANQTFGAGTSFTTGQDFSTGGHDHDFDKLGLQFGAGTIFPANEEFGAGLSFTKGTQAFAGSNTFKDGSTFAAGQSFSSAQNFYGAMEFGNNTVFDVAIYGHQNDIYDAAFFDFFAEKIPNRKAGFPPI